MKKKNLKSMEKLLNIPEVSQKDLATAQKALEQRDARVKARLSLQYWLQTKGVKKIYDQKGMDYKREFLEKWLLS